MKKRKSLHLLAKSRDFLHKKIWLLQIVDWLVLLMMVGFSWWLMIFTFGYSDGQFEMRSKLYSDFGAHLPLIRSFSHGQNFPPEYPFFVGEPIRYHYFFYLVVGLLERVGVPIAIALNTMSALGMTLLLWMVYKISLLFFRRRWVGLLAVMLVLFNGSLAFVEYFTQNGWTVQALLAIPEQVHFASFGPWSGRLVSAFWTWNIFTNQRHLAWGYGLVLALIYPLLRVVFGRKSTPSIWLLIGLVLGFAVLPLLHQASYLILIGLTFGLILLYWRQTRPLWLAYGVASAISIAIFLLLSTGTEQQWEWIFGYLSPDKSILGMLEYWGYNLGLYLVLFPIVLIWSIKKRNYFLLITTVFFVIANVMRLSTDMINNHKFVNFFVMTLSIMTAGFIGRLWQKYRWARLGLPAVVLLLIASGILDFFPIINDYSGKTLDEPRSPIQAYIRQYTPPRSQFVTTTYMYNPASLAGRMLFLDYGYHAWSMGYQDRAKRELLPRIFSPSIDFSSWCDVVLPAGIDYILIDPRPEAVEDGRIDVASSRIAKDWQPEYTSPEGWRLYNVAKLCLPL